MIDKNVPAEIQNKVRSYLFYVEYEKNFYSHEPIFNKLTEKLKNDLMYEGYASLYK
jgi:hypothetical protein